VDADRLVRLSAVVNQDSIKRCGQSDGRVSDAGAGGHKGCRAAGAWRSAKGHCDAAGSVSTARDFIGRRVGRGGRIDSGAGQVQRSLESVGSRCGSDDARAKVVVTDQQFTFETCAEGLSVSDDSSLLGLYPIQVFDFAIFCRFSSNSHGFV